MSIRIGIIGAGAMARAHLGALYNDPRAELVALSSRTRANAEGLCESFGLDFVEDWQQLLNMNLDAIYVLTPDGFHRDYAVAVLENNIHLFLEKSLELDLSKAREIVAAGKAAAAKGVKTLMGYPLRFDPHFQLMKKVLSDSSAGKVLYGSSIRTHFLTNDMEMYDKYRDENYSPPAWYFEEKNFGPIYSHGSHDYDYMRWFADSEVKSVYAVARRCLLPEGSAPDAFFTTLEFENGAIANVSTPWITRVEYDMITIAAENVTVQNQNNKVLWQDATMEAAEEFEYDLWANINGHFLDVVEDKAEPLCTLEDGFAAVTIATAAVQSSKSGAPVKIVDVK
jgi:predicted dehydrogenase